MDDKTFSFLLQERPMDCRIAAVRPGIKACDVTATSCRNTITSFEKEKLKTCSTVYNLAINSPTWSMLWIFQDIFPIFESIFVEFPGGGDVLLNKV